MEETKLSHYQKYKDIITKCSNKWLENPENKEKARIRNRNYARNKRAKEQAIIAKYNEIIKTIEN